MEKVNIGILIFANPGGYNPGSNLILDSTFSNIATAAIVLPDYDAKTLNSSAMLILDSVRFVSVNTGILQAFSTLVAGGSHFFNSWALGRIYDQYSPNGRRTDGGELYPLRFIDGSLQAEDESIFERSKPQYESTPASGFINVKTAGAAGDGTTDDTNTLNRILRGAGNSVIFFPAGVYIITGTLFVPAGTRIVGQLWSQIMATGPAFSSMQHPKVAVRVGNPGDSGIVEIQDMMFTTKGSTPGAVLLEWNINSGGQQGQAAMWDSHFRVGGATGTGLDDATCPKLSGLNLNCVGVSLMMHIRSQASAYIENVWGWTADHHIDSVGQTQIDIYSGRGLLVESNLATWLYGTAFEHNILYNYQFYKSSKVWMGMIQTESPYFQGWPAAPTPFENSLGQFAFDPPFDHCPIEQDWYTCAFSWGVRIIYSQEIYVYGAGLYSWFQEYDQVSHKDLLPQQILTSRLDLCAFGKLPIENASNL